jgi:electron transfer flavoprotein beta subunit
MKVLVPIKRVVDPNVRVRVKSDNSGVETANVKMSMNPFDEIAVEEAVRLKEAGTVSEIMVVSIGVDKCQDIIRTAMAMGADSGILVKTDTDVQPLAIAKILQNIIGEQSPDFVIMGKQAIDNDNNQTGQMLAALLDWGQGTFISKLDIKDGAAEVTREVDGGLITISVKLPAVFTTDLRLNEPRYVALPNIMKARSKPLEIKDIAEYGVDIENRVNVVFVAEPEKRQAGIKVKDTEELVNKLKEAGVI